jgi:Tfp pilus assembly protein PilF
MAEQGRLEPAIAAFQKTISLKPDLAVAHSNLGNVLARQGRLEQAIAAYQKAISLKADDAGAHYSLGNVLAQQGRLEPAIAAYQKAISLKPDDAAAHSNLGNVLYRQGRLEPAIAAYQKAISVEPDDARAHCNLGHALQRAGQLTSALASLRRGHELGSRNLRWPYPSARWVQEAERLVALDAKLPDILRGQAQPANNQERVELARLCQQPYNQFFAASARLWQKAFAADPKLSEDSSAGYRHSASCAAALASCGAGADAGKLDEPEKARWRKQALDWLRADLSLWAKQLDSTRPADRTTAQRTLRWWQNDKDLAGVREPAALAKLPESERQLWQKLWADVAALLAKVEMMGGRPQPR